MLFLGEKNVFYWKGNGEIDFLIQQKTSVTHVFQVVADGLDDEAILEREVGALHEAAHTFPKAKLALIVKQPPKKPVKSPYEIIPLWQLLLYS